MSRRLRARAAHARALLIGLALLALVRSSVAASPQLVSPWSNITYSLTSNIACPPPTDFTAPVLPASYISSVVGSSTEFEELTRVLASQLDYFSRASDYAVDAGDTHRADCILEQLQVYAANNAFVCDATRVVNETGSDPSGTKYWRTLYTSGLATALLKASAALDWSSTRMAEVQQWFSLMQACNKNWTVIPLEGGGAGVSAPTHAAYPGLLSILLTSTITQDADNFDWAANQLSAALDTISSDGTAAGTVAGEANALYFQASGILMYAMPAALLVHANRANGTGFGANLDLPDIASHPGLARLAWRTADSLANVTYFEAASGKSQTAVACTDYGWGWLYYNLLERSTPRGNITMQAVTATTQLGIPFDKATMLGLLTGCDPEDTFVARLGGRVCWWEPMTFYGSPCTGWTAGPIIAFAVASLTLVALLCFCACFMCGGDEFMAWANLKRTHTMHMMLGRHGAATQKDDAGVQLTPVHTAYDLKHVDSAQGNNHWRRQAGNRPSPNIAGGTVDDRVRALQADALLTPNSPNAPPPPPTPPGAVMARGRRSKKKRGANVPPRQMPQMM